MDTAPGQGVAGVYCARIVVVTVLGLKDTSSSLFVAGVHSTRIVVITLDRLMDTPTIFRVAPVSCTGVVVITLPPWHGITLPGIGITSAAHTSVSCHLTICITGALEVCTPRVIRVLSGDMVAPGVRVTRIPGTPVPVITRHGQVHALPRIWVTGIDCAGVVVVTHLSLMLALSSQWVT